jgi:hypothetical protein
MALVSEAASNTRTEFSSATATPLIKQAARSQAKIRATPDLLTMKPPTMYPREYNAK